MSIRAASPHRLEAKKYAIGKPGCINSLLGAACPHRLEALQLDNLGCIRCCGQPARTAFKPSNCESWVPSLLRAACPHAALKHYPIGNLGCVRCCGQPARTALKPSGSLPEPPCMKPSNWESWVHSLVRAACPHRLEAFQLGILGASAAAGSLPAPP